MSSSLKTGLVCKHCERHSSHQTVAKQWGEHHDNPLACADMTLKVNGRYICCKCGMQLGTDEASDLPDQVAEIIATLIQDCLFRVSSVTNHANGQPFIWLENRALDGARCQVRWFRDERFDEQLPGQATRLNAIEYDPSKMKQRPPAIVDHTLRMLTSKGVTLTEIPHRDPHYAHLGAVIKRYDQLLAPRRNPAEPICPEHPPQVENLAAPLIVQVQLQWKSATTSE
ncbi:MAG TPA: hypothetical protein V6C86_00330 [Oculatellaceae cyanobacterium]